MCCVNRIRRLFGSLACVLMAVGAAQAQTTYYVDDDGTPGNGCTSWADACPHLQTALGLAVSGDQIWVAGGTYVGNFTLALGVEVYGGFASNETELSQRDWTANPTILDGNGTGSVVTSPSWATETTRIDGFTITNGSGTVLGLHTYGGGLYLRNSSPTIANNTITDNSVDYYDDGGGLYLDSSSPTITNNTIMGNSAGSGGGLHLLYSSPTIANNTITANIARWGGGLDLDYSSPTIANNTIMGNTADHQGGGLYLFHSSPRIANTIVAFNSSGIFSFGTPTLRYNCVYGNTACDYDGLSDPTGTNGNISADPLFAGPQYGNVHIQPDSPCIDAGSNTNAFGDSDMDGEPRIQGGIVDIGADESDGTARPAGPYVIVRVSPAGDDANDGSSWALVKRTVQAGIYAAFALGGEVWVQTGTYYECVTLPPYVYLYGGFAGGETARDERDWDANVTTLDGQRQGSVVTARGGYRVNAIDGFNITNGSSVRGGGLYLEESSPTIANNTIMGNDASLGGGLYLEESSPTITNNTIMGNEASYDGGGVCLRYSSPTIVNNTIMGNEASYFGGGLDLGWSSSTIANNTITGNIASLRGGGLYLWYSSPTIANNTITGNSAEHGGGLVLDDSSPTIANTIVAFNSSGIHRGLVGSPTLQYNCVYGNTDYDYSDLDDPTGTAGNIWADPVFAQNPEPGPDGLWGTPDDDFGDLLLSSGSPCIDAGDNAALAPSVLTDLDGHPRFVNDPLVLDTGNPGAQGPPIVDMGAYERQVVLLDILPRRCPNRANVKSRRLLPMAIVGTDVFDVMQIDPDSLVLMRADGVGGSVRPVMRKHEHGITIEDVAAPFDGDLCGCHKLHGDGIDDLVAMFSMGDMADVLDLGPARRGELVTLTVSGLLLDGRPFEASDCILITGRR